MKKFLLAVCIVTGIVACATPEPTLEFKYALGNSTDYRYGETVTFYHNPADSTANFIVSFSNDDTLHLLWVTPCFQTKTNYLFGETYGVDSDVMILKFQNNEGSSPYWAMDQGQYKSGSITFTSWDNNKLSGNFDFSANTINPLTFTTSVFNFKGSFSNISITQ